MDSWADELHSLISSPNSGTLPQLSEGQRQHIIQISGETVSSQMTAEQGLPGKLKRMTKEYKVVIVANFGMVNLLQTLR